MLYSCKNNINSNEIGKMVPYFWKKFYLTYVVNGAILNLIISIIVFICCQSIIEALILFISLFIFCLIYYKAKLPTIVTKSMSLYIDKKKINTEIEINFYDNHLIQKKNDKTIKIYYDKFNKNIETDTNFYLQYLENGKEKIIIIQKNNCTLELIQFIRKKISNIEKELGQKVLFENKDKLKETKFVKISILLLTILSVLSILGGLLTVAIYNEVNNISDKNFIKSTWLFLLWLPLPVISVIINRIYLKRGIDCSKSIVIAGIASVFLLVFSSFSIIPNSLNSDVDDYNTIQDYKTIMNVNIPSTGQLKLRTMKSFDYKNISDLTIITVNYKHEDTTLLVNDIINNDNWILSTQLSSEFEELIPAIFTYNDSIYYLFYNKTLDEYNSMPNADGNYRYYTIKYDVTKKNLLIYTFDYQFS